MVPETGASLPAFIGVSLAWGGSFLCIKWPFIFLTPFGFAFAGGSFLLDTELDQWRKHPLADLAILPGSPDMDIFAYLP
jgi:hypothetical protein